MREPEAVAALIGRIVADAQIPSRAKRDDLRRELSAHFEDAAASPGTIEEALRRFGPESTVAESFGRIYRRDVLLLRLARIAASVIASVAAALVIQLLVSLRVDTHAEAWRLASGFPRAAGISVAVVLALVTTWEAARPPFGLSRAALAVAAYAAVCIIVQLLFATGIRAFVTAAMLVVLGHVCCGVQPRPARLLLVFGAFAAALYGNHLVLRVAFGLSRAVPAAAALVVVWSSTVLILRRVDRAFVSFLPQTRMV